MFQENIQALCFPGFTWAVTVSCWIVVMFVPDLFPQPGLQWTCGLYSEQTFLFEKTAQCKTGGFQRLSLSVSHAYRRVSHWFAFFICCVEHYFIFLVSSLSAYCQDLMISKICSQITFNDQCSILMHCAFFIVIIPHLIFSEIKINLFSFINF